MFNLKLVLAPEAKKDLRDIYAFGKKQWGLAQSNRYLDLIKAQFRTLTEQPFVGIERPDLSDGYRSFSVGSHVVFYREAANSIEIIRVLHSRQDPTRHLKQS